MLCKDTDENMFVSYSHPRFDCKKNASLFEIHGHSFVSSIDYTSVPLWTYSFQYQKIKSH